MAEIKEKTLEKSKKTTKTSTAAKKTTSTAKKEETPKVKPTTTKKTTSTAKKTQPKAQEKKVVKKVIKEDEIPLLILDEDKVLDDNKLNETPKTTEKMEDTSKDVEILDLDFDPFDNKPIIKEEISMETKSPIEEEIPSNYEDLKEDDMLNDASLDNKIEEEIIPEKTEEIKDSKVIKVSDKKTDKKEKKHKEKTHKNIDLKSKFSSFSKVFKKKNNDDIKTSDEELLEANEKNQDLDIDEIRKSSRRSKKAIKVAKSFMSTSFVLMLLMLILSAMLFIFAISTSQNMNNPSFGNVVTVRKTQDIETALLKFDPEKKNDSLIKKSSYIQFFNNKGLVDNAIIVFYSADDNQYINKIGKITRVYNDRVIVETLNQKDVEIPLKRILGVYDQPLSNMSKIISLFENKYMFLYVSIIPSIIIIFIMLASYMVLSFNKGINKRYSEILSRQEKEREEKEREEKYLRLSEAITKTSSTSQQKQKTYNVTEEKIVPLMNEKTGGNIIQNTNYFTDVVSSDNSYYQKIEKYNESIARMKEIGAGDMDIIRVNMLGNDKFDELLNISRSKAEHMDLDEIIRFLNSLPDVHCIKKAGKINWTYKYKSKTLAIIREDAKKVYRIAFKLYPDAANKINSIFMAFEDSNFPASPYWYMVNNLRNIPLEIVKWALEESYKISMYQQIKTDFLREDKPLTDFVSKEEIKRVVDTKQEIHNFESFITVIKKINGDPKTTLLEEKVGKINMNEYNKEFFFPLDENNAVSVLLSKKASESLATALSNDFYDLILNKVVNDNFDPFDNSYGNKNESLVSNDIVKKTDSTVVIKKITKKK